MTEDVGGLSRVTLFQYDRLGRMIRQIANDGSNEQTTTYAYDRVGRRTRIVYPDSADHSDPANCTDCVKLVYDKAGRLTKRTDPRGVFADFTYDDRGLLTSRGTTGQSPLVNDTFEYDGLGRMTLARRQVDSIQTALAEMSYNDLSRLTSESQTLSGSARTFSYQYDRAGNRRQVACLAMVFKLCESAARTWRLLNGAKLLPDVIAGVAFINGEKAEKDAA